MPNLRTIKKRLKLRYKDNTEKKDFVDRKVKEVLEQEREEFEYREDLIFEGVKYAYLKPSETLINKAHKFLKEKYLEGMSSGNPYNYFSYWNIYYSYTKIVNGAVIKYQFSYFIDPKNRSVIGAEGNQFDLLIVFDYKNSRGLWNERLQYSGMAGYVYRRTYHSLIRAYRYDKKHDEGAMRWGYHEYSSNYKKIKINDYFSISTGRRNAFSTQRIIGLNPNHVEMLYKLGYENLWDRRIADKKVEFLKKHMKELDKKITVIELSKAYVLNKKGLSLKNLKDVIWFINNFKFHPYKFDFNRTKGSDFSWSSQKGTKTTDVNKILRMMNLTKEHGMEHLVTCRGVCYYFDMDFEVFIFKGLKERESVIEAWKKQEHQYKLKLRRERAKELREKKKKDKLRLMSFEEFCKNNKVVYEKISGGVYQINSINNIPMDERLNINWRSIGELYEEQKEYYEFEKENQIVIKKYKDFFILESVNETVLNKKLYNNSIREIKKEYENHIYEQKIKKTTLEQVTESFKEVKIGNFTFTPLRTMKEFQEIQDSMSLCLMRNEYYKKVMGEKSMIYIVQPQGVEKTKGEVVEFKIKGDTIQAGQISGAGNKSTEYYEEIKAIANKLTKEQLVQQGA